MEIAFTKGPREDRIVCTRADGSGADTTFPHKGPVPHDAVHFFVERAFGLTGAFWGLIAQGRHPEELAEFAKAGGHASAKRAGVPDAAIVALVQAERIVECFEAELWAMAGRADADDAALLEVAATACEASLVPMPAVPNGAVVRARDELAEFARGWIAAPIGHSVRLTWEE